MAGMDDGGLQTLGLTVSGMAPTGCTSRAAFSDEMLVCGDCEPEGGDAASVTSEVGCSRAV